MCVNGQSNSLCRCILAFWQELGEGGLGHCPLRVRGLRLLLKSGRAER